MCLVVLQINQQKCEIADGINPAKRLTEFDAVEEFYLALILSDISQVKVAMAFTNKTVFEALFQCG